MKNMLLLEIYQFLKERGVALNESEFSEHWLGQSEGYVRKLRSTKSEPSDGALAICASRLLNASEQLSRVPRYHDLAQQYRSLSDRCRQIVDAEAVEFELAT
jgi:hypothetical protein